MRASESQLDQLHQLVASITADELTRASSRASMSPNDADQAVSPQLISQALKLLSMAGVTAPAASKRIENIADKLADLDLDEEALAGLRFI